jgi:hypothetical protein
MEPEDPLPHSQVPATCPCPETFRSSPYTTSHFLRLLLDNILPSKPGSPTWSLTLRFPHQNPVYASPLQNACYMPRPSRSSRFYHPNGIWWGVQVIQLLIMHFSPLPCYLVPLLNTLYSKPLSLCSSLNVSYQVSQPNKTTGKIIVLYIVIFKFFNSKLKDQTFCTNDSKHSLTSICS